MGGNLCAMYKNDKHNVERISLELESCATVDIKGINIQSQQTSQWLNHTWDKRYLHLQFNQGIVIDKSFIFVVGINSSVFVAAEKKR